MGWAKFDDQYATHPKLVGDLEARGLDAAGICQCAKDLTDGFVSDTTLLLIAAGARQPHAIAMRLVLRDRWSRDDDRGGYWIHDYLEYNPTREQELARREADKQRKATQRKKAGRGATGQFVSGRTSERTANGHPPGRPSDGGQDSDRTGAGRPPDVPPYPIPKGRSISAVNHQVGLAIVGNGEMDQPQEPPPPRLPDPIVERMLTAWPEARRRKLAGAALAVVAEARRWLDAGLIDEVVGHMLAMAPPPATPRYLLTVAPDWAQQRGANLSAEALARMASAAKLPTERASA